MNLKLKMFSPFTLGAVSVIAFSLISFLTSYFIGLSMSGLISVLVLSIAFAILFAFVGFNLLEDQERKSNSRLTNLDLKISLILVIIAFTFFLLFVMQFQILVRM